MTGALLSVTECAERKGVKRQTIHAAIQRGAIPATKVGGYYAIKPEDCDAYVPVVEKSERARRGAAKKAAQPGQEPKE